MDTKSFGGAMQIGDLVRTKETYLPKPRPLGLIVGSKIWEHDGHAKGKLTFLVQFVDDFKTTWWTEEYLEVVCE